MPKRNCDDYAERIEQAATGYFTRGFKLVLTYPINPDGRCSCHGHCDQAGKHPINGKRRGALHTLPELLARLKRYPGAGLGILTGKASGLIAIDVDPRHDGRIEDTGNTLRVYYHDRLVCELPHTLIQRTGGGGWHLIYAYREGIRNGALAPEKAVDVLSDGSCIVAAPTVHKTGNRYEWQPHDITPCPDLPPTIKPKLKPQALGTPVPTTITPTDGADIRSVISQLLIANHEGKLTYTGELTHRCIQPDHTDRRPSASWNESKGTDFCHACGRGWGFVEMARLLGVELKGPAAATRTRATQWLQWIASQQWRGTKGITTRLAATWIARDFLRTGQATRRYSERYLADSLAIARETAGNAIETLTILMPLMRCVAPANGPRSRTFALLPAPGHGWSSISGQSSLWSPKREEIELDTGLALSISVVTQLLTSDAYRNGRYGLGKGSVPLWAELARRDVTTWSQLLAFHPIERTLGRWLAKLSVAGLVAENDNGEWVALVPDNLSERLDKLASHLGTAGAGKRQANQHKRHRVAHRMRIGRELLPDGTEIDTTTGEVLVAGFAQRSAPMPTPTPDPAPMSQPQALECDWHDLDQADSVPMNIQVARWHGYITNPDWPPGRLPSSTLVPMISARAAA